MRILVTGCAGFIGFHLSKSLIEKKIQVIGIDNLNDYYDVNLKKNRLKILKKSSNFVFKKLDLINKNKINLIIKEFKIKYIVHLAAQAGVRYSIDNPGTYFKNNLEVFFNILELSKINKVKHLVFASTSSVYGNNSEFPLQEKSNTDKPLSFYAASKKSNEVMAYSYSHIYQIPTTALRFFTVYGPFGRPDMALFKFTKNIIENKKIELYNNGDHLRDFTYIDDIVNGIYSIITKPSKNFIPYNVFNIGNGSPKKLLDYLKIIEKNLRKKAKIKNLPLQLGDIKKTHSNISALNKYSNYKSSTSIEKGISKFINWYREYYKK